MLHCGVLNIDKPAGMSSRDVVNHVERLVRPAKAGHAGTLDPLATGVLAVCVGHATRLISFIQQGRKRYRGRFVLGQQRDTDDITGQLIDEQDWSTVTKDCVLNALPEFTGRILQIPPQFSAVHVQGRRAYQLARRGQTVEIDARPVDVHSLILADFEPPEFELEIECGSGTYVRSIGRDLGIRLKCGAAMTSLRRTQVGGFELEQAVALDQVTAETLDQHLLPAAKIVADFPWRCLNADESIAVRCGRAISFHTDSINPPNSTPDAPRGKFTGSQVALIDVNQELIGIGEFDLQDQRICPRIIFPRNAMD